MKSPACASKRDGLVPTTIATICQEKIYTLHRKPNNKFQKWHHKQSPPTGPNFGIKKHVSKRKKG